MGHHRIFGIDQQSNVATLAIVNMIFRGDGKNNIINDDCLARGIVSTTVNGENSGKFVSKDEIDLGEKPITKVLMNPPFALSKSDEKEYKFISHALEQMEDGGLLFSILPCAAMVKGGSYGAWRRGFLQNNTLLSVITFPNDLFQPQSMPSTLAMITKKGYPHPHEQGVLWIKIKNDGYRKIKGKRLPNPRIPNEFLKVETLISSFLTNPNIQVETIPEFQIVAPIDFNDDEPELIPEAYLDENTPTVDEIQQGVEDSIRDTVAFLIRSKQEEMIFDE